MRALDSNLGPLIVAVEHHAPELVRCWIVCSPQVRKDFKSVRDLVKALAPQTECDEISIENSNSILDVQRKIESVCDSFEPYQGLKSGDIIADITSGNSIMTGGMILAASGRDLEIEYLRQDERLVRQDPNCEPWALTREQIKEKRLLVSLHRNATTVRHDVFEFGTEPP
jgi:hypothetical protein